MSSTYQVARVAGLFPAVDYLRAQRVRRQFMEQIDAAMADVDVYVTAPRVGSNLVLTNLTGHPTCIQRAGMIEGMPHQIEFTELGWAGVFEVR